jgi:tetratricopeptide (TPR) repeat protein
MDSTKNHHHNCDEHHHHHAHEQGCDHHHHTHEQGCGHHHHAHEQGCDHHHHTHSDHKEGFSTAEIEARHKNSLDDLMAEAESCFQQHAYAKTASLLEIALSKFPEEAAQNEEEQELYRNLQQQLAFSFGLSEQNEKSLTLWKSIIAHNGKIKADVSDQLDAYLNAAFVCFSLAKEEDFLNFCNTGLKLATDNDYTSFQYGFEHLMGQYSLDIGDFVKAEKLFSQALEKAKDHEDKISVIDIQMDMATLFTQTQQKEKARTLLENTLTLCKDEDVRDEVEQERIEIEALLAQIKNISLKEKMKNF